MQEKEKGIRSINCRYKTDRGKVKNSMGVEKPKNLRV